ncbi:MAG TPA: hypothetical protein DCM86_09320 [Verrucomicrobiales bacterium]|nr:hypothetical protein [Verrucomicrobiales bacterium]
MKTNSWFTFALFSALLAGAGFAAQPSHSKAHAAKPAAAKPAAPAPASDSAEALSAGPAVTKQDHVNVRSRPDTESDVVTHLKKHEMVTVVEEVFHKKAGPGEPTRWAKIAWPSEVPVWVYADFVDHSGSAVKVAKVNLRSGPGENFAVVGTLQKGTSIKKLDAKGDWWKIEAPEGCHAYIAANLLEAKPAAAPVVVSTPPPSAPKPAPLRPAPVTAPPPPISPAPLATAPPPPVAVNDAAPDAAATGLAPAPALVPRPFPRRPVAPAPAFGNPAPAAPAPSPVTLPPAVPPPAPKPAETVAAKPATPPPLLSREPGEINLRPVHDETYIKRVVTREGLVRRTYNIQAPTYLVLENLHNGRVMNYLYATSTNLNLQSYRGRVVTVTGEEALDERWPSVPVIRVETLETAP